MRRIESTPQVTVRIEQYDMGFGAVIMLNAVAIGIETDAQNSRPPETRYDLHLGWYSLEVRPRRRGARFVEGVQDFMAFWNLEIAQSASLQKIFNT